MSHYFAIIFSALLINNFVLSQFLGLCPFLGVSKKETSAIGMGLATAFVLTISASFAWFIDNFLLIPYGLEYLRTLSFIVSIAVLVSFTEMFIAKKLPFLHQVLGIYLPLITTNCAVLGVCLLNSNRQHSLIETAIYSFSAAGGFFIVLVLFAAIREKIAVADIPEPFRGTPIAMISAGILAVAFMGFSAWI